MGRVRGGACGEGASSLRGSLARFAGGVKDKIAERKGFEPLVGSYAHSRFPGEPLRPLRHLSVKWRRERDFNSRSDLIDSKVQASCNRALCHLSEIDRVAHCSYQHAIHMTPLYKGITCCGFEPPQLGIGTQIPACKPGSTQDGVSGRSRTNIVQLCTSGLGNRANTETEKWPFGQDSNLHRVSSYMPTVSKTVLLPKESGAGDGSRTHICNSNYV